MSWLRIDKYFLKDVPEVPKHHTFSTYMIKITNSSIDPVLMFFQQSHYFDMTHLNSVFGWKIMNLPC